MILAAVLIALALFALTTCVENRQAKRRAERAAVRRYIERIQ